MFINKSYGEEREKQKDKQNLEFDKHNSRGRTTFAFKSEWKTNDAAIIEKIRNLSIIGDEKMMFKG